MGERISSKKRRREKQRSHGWQAGGDQDSIQHDTKVFNEFHTLLTSHHRRPATAKQKDQRNCTQPTRVGVVITAEVMEAQTSRTIDSQCQESGQSTIEVFNKLFRAC